MEGLADADACGSRDKTSDGEPNRGHACRAHYVLFKIKLTEWYTRVTSHRSLVSHPPFLDHKHGGHRITNFMRNIVWGYLIGHGIQREVYQGYRLYGAVIFIG